MDFLPGTGTRVPASKPLPLQQAEQVLLRYSAGHGVQSFLQGVKPSNWGVLGSFSSNRHHTADGRRGLQPTWWATIWFWPWNDERSFLALRCWIKKTDGAWDVGAPPGPPGPFLVKVIKIKSLDREPWVSKSLFASENHLFGLKRLDFPKNLKTKHFRWSLSREGGSTQYLLESPHIYIISFPPYKGHGLKTGFIKPRDCCSLIKYVQVAGPRSIIWSVSRLRIFIFQRMLWFLRSQTGRCLCTGPCRVLLYPLTKIAVNTPDERIGHFVYTLRMDFCFNAQFHFGI